jgi:flagellar M-ring protein FliF
MDIADLKNLPNIIKELPSKKRTALFSAVVVSLAFLILFILWSQKEEYSVLFSNISQSDAGHIIQKLKEMKIPYKVDSNNIYVTSDKVYDIRLQLASQGLPQGGGVGFELFDKTSFGTTDFVQKLNYTRALQGELARTIMSLSEVQQCRVHLAIPQKSLFSKDDEAPTASILVKLVRGRTLSQSQIYGIVHLVSSSVEGLNPKNVTIIDDTGELLTPKRDEIMGLTNTQFEYQQRYEKLLESKVIEILEPIVGKGKVRAKVAASIDFSKIEKMEERYDPDSQVVRSEQKNSEKSMPAISGGIPGVSSNVPNKPSQIGMSQEQSEKKNETINYEISKMTSHIINPSGEIKRLSVAVIVDGNYTSSQGAKEKKYVQRTDEEIRYYEELVKKAVGYTESRGDEVKVVNMPFEIEPAEEAKASITDYIPVAIKTAKYFAPLLVAVLFFLFIIRPLMKNLAIQKVTQQVPEMTTKVEVPESLEERKELSFSKERLIEWVEHNPMQAVNLIKTWIEEKK